MTWDLIVIGAGMGGLAAATHAARAGWRVLILDRSDSPPGGATAVAAGMLAPLAEAHDMPDEVLVDAIESAQRYPAFLGALGIDSEEVGYLSSGTLLVGADRDQLGELVQLQRFHARLGVAAERITVAEALRREPGLNPRISGALWCPDDHSIQPVLLAHALLRAAQRAGATVRSGTNVHAIRSEGHWVVEAEDIEFESARVLVAAGAASASLLAPWADLGLRPVKGQLIRLRGEALLTRVVRSTRAYLVPRGSDLIVGASEEEMGWDERALAGVTLDLLYEAWRLIPGVYDLEVVGTRVGHRPSTRGGRPFVGELPGAEGLYASVGHHRHGVLLAPWTASELARAWGLARVNA